MAECTVGPVHRHIRTQSNCLLITPYLLKHYHVILELQVPTSLDILLTTIKHAITYIGSSPVAQLICRKPSKTGAHNPWLQRYINMGKKKWEEEDLSVSLNCCC